MSGHDKLKVEVAQAVEEERHALALRGELKTDPSTTMGSPMSDPDNDWRVKQPPQCEGCGGPAHGPTNHVVACLTHHLRLARGQQTGEPISCSGCDKTHPNLELVVSCQKRALKKAREQQRIGVTKAEFEENQRLSKQFDETRGRAKKSAV